VIQKKSPEVRRRILPVTIGQFGRLCL
jgi:hypothetical protein